MQIGKHGPLPLSLQHQGYDCRSWLRLPIAAILDPAQQRMFNTLFARLAITNKPFDYEGRTAVETAHFDEFTPRGGNLNLTLGSVGLKVNPVGDLLFSANVLFPLNEAGLRSRLTTVVGLDYAF